MECKRSKRIKDKALQKGGMGSSFKWQEGKENQIIQ
jgi:hypothetical protein